MNLRGTFVISLVTGNSVLLKKCENFMPYYKQTNRCQILFNQKKSLETNRKQGVQILKFPCLATFI